MCVVGENCLWLLGEGELSEEDFFVIRILGGALRANEIVFPRNRRLRRFFAGFFAGAHR